MRRTPFVGSMLIGPMLVGPMLVGHMLVGHMLVGMLLLVSSVSGWAQSDSGSAPPQAARVVLVLSGGGARGAAHIGVLQAIERMRIPVAAIVGTSMGAVVGGLYAAGYAPDELERIFEDIDWNDFFIDDPDRALFRFRSKREDADYLVSAAAGIGWAGLKLPSGAVYGQKVLALLKRRTLHTVALESFDALPIPFRAVATDIVTAEPVVLADASLAEAMYASMAIPALMAPTKVDGRLLVDGGVSNNLPIDVALALGADVIIAVDISSPLLPEEAFTSLIAVTDQLTTVLTRRNTEAQLARLRPQDVLITPPLMEVSAVDFSTALATIEVGERATLDARARLEDLALPEPAYAEWQRTVRRSPRTSIEVVDIRVDTDSRVRPEVLLRQAGIRPGKLTLNDLDTAAHRLYGTELFAYVSYRYEDGVLVLQPRRKPWGPFYAQVGINLEDDFEGRNAYNLGVAFTATELNGLGGEWRTEASVGDRPLFFNELYQPFGRDARWFIASQVAYDGFNLGLFDSGELSVEYRIRRLTAGLELGRAFGTTSELRFGVRSGLGTIDRVVGESPFEAEDAGTGFVFSRFAYDDLDNLHFPTRGVAFDVAYTVADRSLGAEVDYRAVELGSVAARSFGVHTLFASGDVAHVVDGDAPLHEKFTLGGFLNLSGLQVNELLGDHRVLVLGGYRYRWYSSPVLPAYVGASVELGQVWATEDDIDAGDLRAAGSVFVGFDTFLGPLYVAGGVAEGGDKAFYVFLGRPF